MISSMLWSTQLLNVKIVGPNCEVRTLEWLSKCMSDIHECIAGNHEAYGRAASFFAHISWNKFAYFGLAHD